MRVLIGLKAVPLVATLVTFAAIVIMLALGLWQLQRANEKQQRLDKLQQRQQRSPYNLSQIKQQQNMQKQADIRDFPVHVSGWLRSDQYLLLDNKIHQGQVGYQVLAPMQTDYGLLLVNFGWLPAPATRQQLPQVRLPQGLFHARGRIALPSLNPMITETQQAGQQWPLLIQQIDLKKISQLMGLDSTQQPLLSFIVQLDADEGSPYVRQWQAVVMPPQKHIAYAVQWFALALTAALIYFFAIKQRHTIKEKTT